MRFSEFLVNEVASSHVRVAIMSKHALEKLANKGDKEAKELLDKIKDLSYADQEPLLLDFFKKQAKKQKINIKEEIDSKIVGGMRRQTLEEGVKHTPLLANASIRAAVSIVTDTQSFLRTMWNDPNSGVKKNFKTFDEFVKDGLRDHTESALNEFETMLENDVWAELNERLKGNLKN